MSNQKTWSPQKYEVKGPNMQDPKQFMASQNLLHNFLKCISNAFFSPRFYVFEAHFQELSTLKKVKIAMDTLAQNLE